MAVAVMTYTTFLRENYIMSKIKLIALYFFIKRLSFLLDKSKLLDQ